MPEPPWLPILLALIAAMLFGFSVVVARMGLAHVGSRTGAFFSIASTAGFYWLLLPFLFGKGGWEPAVFLRFVGIFALIGLVTPGLSLLLAFEGNRRLGPTISSTLASTSPLFAVFSAVLVLGERPTWNILAGTLGIVVGVMVLSLRGSGGSSWPFWAIVFPLGAAFFRGVVHMGTKYGMGLMPAPFTAALITFTAAVAVSSFFYRAGGAREEWGGVRRSLRWFLLTGVLNGTALLSMNAALITGRVVVVSPVVATFPLFTFALSLLLRMDRFGTRVLLGVLLVVGGVIAVTGI